MHAEAAFGSKCGLLRKDQSNPAPDPIVWTGRALQAGIVELAVFGLAHLYPALQWSLRAPGHHGYPRAPVLILRQALKGRMGRQISGCAGETVPPSPQSSSQTAVGFSKLFCSVGLVQSFSFRPSSPPLPSSREVRCEDK
jgi:hypothetical protein